MQTLARDVAKLPGKAIGVKLIYSILALVLIVLLQFLSLVFFHLPHRSKCPSVSPSRTHQNIWYSVNAVTMGLPLGLLVYLHFHGDFLDTSDIALVASLLMLFLGAFYPVIFVRVLKPSISRLRLGSIKLLDESEQRANLWAEVFLGAGSLTAILATLYVGYNNEVSHFSPVASTKCLALLRDYIAPPLGPQNSVSSRPSLEKQQAMIREACASMR